MRAIVYGNGESRPQQPIIGGDFITWGCNAAYRDFNVDNLVSVDYNMQQEIYESEYVFNNKCWFSDWEVLPAGFDPHAITGYHNMPIFETPRLGRESCVVQGKTQETVDANIREALYHNPKLDHDDLKKKAEFNVGLYITWVEEYNDKVVPIDYPKGYSAGNTAIHLACQFKFQEIYMLGFDLSSYNDKLNNIYKGSKNYLPEDSRGFNPINWVNQLEHTFREFPNTKFYWVKKELTTAVHPLNVTQITYETFNTIT